MPSFFNEGIIYIMTTKTKNIVTQSWQDSSQELLRYIVSKIHIKEDAEDILQDVYIKTIQKVATLRPDTNLNAWLYTVTKNAINDYFRLKQRKPMDELGDNQLSDSVSENSKNDGFCCLDPHINELPEKYRQVIILSEIEGKKHQEIADTLNLSLSAIKSRVVRGREMLKDKFISCCKYHVNDEGKLSGEADCDNINCAN